MAEHATFQINGYGVVLPHVQNFYPIEGITIGYQWGFKYKSGVFEFFQFATKREAVKSRNQFIEALEAYYKNA